MRKLLISKFCVLASLVSVLAACEQPRYVDNNGVSYYDANDVSTDTLPSSPYTKNGQYINNPDEAVNTRDDRGNRPQGYGHNVDEDYRQSTLPPPGGHPIYPAGTVIYGDNTIVYPDGTVVYPGDHATTTTTTTVVQHNW